MTRRPLRERSPLVYVLVALIPYSKPNLLLSFKPGLFFIELEKVSRYKRHTLESAYRRAQQQGLIEHQKNIVKLTAEGRQKIAPFIAQKIKGAGKLMIIFDIPEEDKLKRQKLRRILRAWKFKQIQKSVWSTNLDYREELVALIKALKIDGCVQIYECSRHFPQ